MWIQGLYPFCHYIYKYQEKIFADIIDNKN